MVPFRVFEEGDQHHAVVALHGWFTEPAVNEVANLVARRMPNVRIDLSQLVGTDQAGLAALRRLRETGVSLAGMNPFFELLLAEDAPGSRVLER
jgi:hypothetical protein